MPIAVSYPCQAARGPRAGLSVSQIRAVAAQVRRQLLADPAELAVALSGLVTAAGEISVNARTFFVQWDLIPGS